MGDEGSERLSDVLTDNKIGDVVEIGRLAVDNHESCAVSLRMQWKPGGRPHHQRGSDRDEEVASGTQLLRSLHFALRHRLPK